MTKELGALVGVHKLSHADAERMRGLYREIASLEAEAAEIVSRYWGRRMYPTRVIEAGATERAGDCGYFNDGHGHCGVHDCSSGESRSLPCPSLTCG